MSEDTNNPVSKFMLDKLQPVLINMLIISVFWTCKVSQGSVVTHLRCGGIFTDPFITQSLLNLLVKEFWK